MEDKSYRVGRNTFQGICFVATVFMAGYCALKYYENEDSSVIAYQHFNEREEDIHPTITLCVSGGSVFDAEKLRENGIVDDAIGNFSMNYDKFLYGDDGWDDKLARLEFDNITIDINDQVNYIKLFDSGEYLLLDVNVADRPFYVSYRHSGSKCFSLDVNPNVFPVLKNNFLYTIEIGLIDVLTTSLLNMQNDAAIDMGLLLHYPKQIFLATETENLLDYDLSKVYDLNQPEICFLTKVAIKHMEAIRRRNTMNNPCNPDWQNYDDYVLQALANKVGCIPPHWSPANTTLPKCSNMTQLFNLAIPDPKLAAQYLFKYTLNNFPPPCDEIEFISTNPFAVSVVVLFAIIACSILFFKYMGKCTQFPINMCHEIHF